jgi:hypothetical protein
LLLFYRPLFAQPKTQQQRVASSRYQAANCMRRVASYRYARPRIFVQRIRVFGDAPGKA